MEKISIQASEQKNVLKDKIEKLKGYSSKIKELEKYTKNFGIESPVIKELQAEYFDDEDSSATIQVFFLKIKIFDLS